MASFFCGPCIPPLSSPTIGTYTKEAAITRTPSTRRLVRATGILLLAFLFGAASFLGRAPQTRATSETIYDGHNTALNGDDNNAAVPIGFNFTFYGTTYSTAYVNINGMLSFGSGSSAYSNTDIPNASAPNNYIAAFWDDLITNIGTGSSTPSIYYYTAGSSPNRTFIVQWTNMYFYNTTVQMGTFQVYLYEGSNQIQVQYRNLLGSGRSNGNSATIGLEDTSASGNSVKYSFNTASVVEGQALRFTPSGSTYSTNASASYQYYFLRDADNPAPDVPTLVSPADAASNQSMAPTFTWNAAANATSYKLLVAANSDFSGVEVNQSGITGTSYTLGSGLAQKNHTYYWRIEAINANGSALSDDRSFTTAPNVVPSDPDAGSLGPTAKVDGSLSAASQPTLNFSLADTDGDQLKYQILIDDSADFGSPTVNYTSALGAQGARTFTVGQAVSGGTYTVGSASQTLASGSYYWEIRALDNYGGASGYAAANTGAIAFRVDVTAPSGLGIPTATSPSTTATPTWTWTAATDANGLASPAYAVQWSQSATFASGVSSATATAASYTHGVALADGTWYFRVRATDSVGNASAYATSAALVVDATAPSAPGTPATTTPSPSARPVWTWTASSDGGTGLASPAYALQWSQDPDFASGVTASTSAAASFTQPADLADGTWYFRVRAVDVAGNASAWSAAGSVTVDTSAPTAPGLPTTSTPTKNPLLSWTWAASADLTAITYTLEWSSSPSFAGARSVTLSTPSYVQAAALADGTWYFRVKAVDALSHASGYSATASVTVDTAAPSVPGTPVASVASGSFLPSWSWDASTDASSFTYAVEWASNPSFTGSASSIATSNAYVHPAALGAGTWYFRAKAVDALGNASDYSAPGTVILSAPVRARTTVTVAPTPSNLENNTATVDAPNVSPTPAPAEPATYAAAVRVVDNDGLPVEGARVEIDGALAGYTDKDGYVRLEGAAAGQHVVLAFFRDQQVRSLLSVGPAAGTAHAAGPDGAYSMDVRLGATSASSTPSWWWLPAAFLAGMAVSGWWFLAAGKRRKEKEEDTPSK